MTVLDMAEEETDLLASRTSKHTKYVYKEQQADLHGQMM